MNGRWVEVPSYDFFSELRHRFVSLPLVAEDLGIITPEVDALRTHFGLPGMKILQFAFGGDAGNPYLPHNHEYLSVAYTGTHDNDTSFGWYSGPERLRWGDGRDFRSRRTLWRRLEATSRIGYASGSGDPP